MKTASNLGIFGIARLLPRAMKAQALLLVSGTVVASLLEVLGLAILIPLIDLITPSTDTRSPLANFIDFLPYPVEPSKRHVYILGICAFVFISKNAFLGAHAWLEARFCFQLYERLSNDLLRKVLNREYEIFRINSPSKLLSMMTAEIVAVIFHGALPALTLTSELIFASAIVVFLLFVEPQITLLVSLSLMALGVILVFASRQVSTRLGDQRHRLEAQRNSELLQAFTGIREIILSRARQKVADHLSSSARKLTSTYRGFQLLATMPRFGLELAVVIVILALVYYDLANGTPSQTIVIQIGLFAASGFRIVIGANRVVMSIQSLRFGRQAVASTLDNLQASTTIDLHSGHLINPAFKPETIRLCSVSYAYGEEKILDCADMTFPSGTLTVVIGRSGAGKSTLLDLVAGLQRCQSGHIYADDLNLADFGDEWYQHIGYVGQTPYIFADTLRRNIALGVEDSEINDDAVWQSLEQAQLLDFARSLGNGLDTEIRENAMEFSGGQRQRIGIARALYRKADVLLLDEPSAALDPETEQKLMETLYSLRHNRIVVLVSHRQASSEHCDLIARLENGKLDYLMPLGQDANGEKRPITTV